MQFSQFFRHPCSLGTLTLLTLLLARGVVPLAEQLFKRPHLGKEHVAIRPARISLAIEILHPEKIRQQLIALCLQVLQGQRMRNLLFERHRREIGGIQQDNFANLLAGQRVRQPSPAETIIVGHCGGQIEFLKRRYALIRGPSHLDRRWLVLKHPRRQLFLDFCVSTIAIDQADGPLLRLLHDERRAINHRAFGIRNQRRCVVVFIDQLCNINPLVQRANPSQLGFLGDGDTPRVFDPFLGLPRIRGWLDRGIASHERRILEHRRTVRWARTPTGFDPIRE